MSRGSWRSRVHPRSVWKAIDARVPEARSPDTSRARTRPRRRAPSFRSKVTATSLLAVLATLVTLASGVVGLLFVLSPGLKPEPPAPVRAVEISELRLDQNATFRQYLARAKTKASGDYTAQTLRKRGAIVSLEITAVGYKGVDLPVSWQLFERRTGTEASKDQSLVITPQANSDTANLDLWIPIAPDHPGTYFVAVELLLERDHGAVVLRRRETEPFSVGATT